MENWWTQLKELQRAGWQMTITPSFTPFGVITSAVSFKRQPNPYLEETASGVYHTCIIPLIDADALPQAIANMHALVFPISPLGDFPIAEL